MLKVTLTLFGRTREVPFYPLSAWAAHVWAFEAIVPGEGGRPVAALALFRSCPYVTRPFGTTEVVASDGSRWWFRNELHGRIAGRGGLGQITGWHGDRNEEIRRAARAFQVELDATAPAIGRILEETV